MIKTLITNQIVYMVILTVLAFPVFTNAQATVNTDSIRPGDIEAREATLPLVGNSSSIPGDFSNDGLYGCEGGKYGSVGLAHARGPFVPVSEEAVALNTNILLYKECILDGVVARIRETMVAFMVKSTFNWVNQTNNGESAFVANQEEFRQSTADNVVKDSLEGSKTANICEPFRQDVRTTLARDYARSTRKPEDQYKCTVPDKDKDNYTAFLRGEGVFNLDTFAQALEPQNNPLTVYVMAQEQLKRDINNKLEDEYVELGWGEGYKSPKACKQIPAGNGIYEERCEITTPGANIKNIIDFVSLTGHRQTESADEIDELMGSLMSNIHTQILTSVGGLKGITDSIGGAASFVDQIASDASDKTEAEYTQAGIGLLTSAIATETAYGASRSSSKDKLEETAETLKAREGACWDRLVAQAKLDLIEEAVALACADIRPTDFGASTNTECTITGSAVSSDNTEPNADNNADENDTTSDIVITANAAGKTVTATLERHNNNSFTKIAQNILPLLRVVSQSVTDSTNALSILAGLQLNLSTSNTPGNTRFVLGQVDQLVRAGKLHKEADIYIAQEQHSQITTTMDSLIDETTRQWEQGWCNPANWRDQIKQ